MVKILLPRKQAHVGRQVGPSIVKILLPRKQVMWVGSRQDLQWLKYYCLENRSCGLVGRQVGRQVGRTDLQWLKYYCLENRSSRQEGRKVGNQQVKQVVRASGLLAGGGQQKQAKLKPSVRVSQGAGIQWKKECFLSTIHPSIHPFIHPSIHPSFLPLAFLLAVATATADTFVPCK